MAPAPAGSSGFPSPLYAHVVVDQTPRQYRVRMYAAEKVSEEQWCAIKRLRRPYRDESATAVIDSRWRTVPQSKTLVAQAIQATCGPLCSTGKNLLWQQAAWINKLPASLVLAGTAGTGS